METVVIWPMDNVGIPKLNLSQGDYSCRFEDEILILIFGLQIRSQKEHFSSYTTSRSSAST